MERLARRALGLVLALGAAGCGGATGPAADDPATAVAAPPPVLELVATAAQTRSDAAEPGRMQLVVDNTGTAAFTVTSVQLDSPGFAVEPATDRGDAFEPGRRYSLPTTFGAVRCDEAPVPAEAVVGLLVEGEARTVRLPLAPDGGLLEGLHARECQILALAAQTGLALGPAWTPVVSAGEPGLATTLTVTRGTATGPVEVRETRGSVLFDVVLPEGPVSLAPGQTQAEVPVVLTSRTCSGHAIGEAKQPYAFLAFIAVDGAEALGAPLEVTPEQEAQLFELIGAACPTLT